MYQRQRFVLDAEHTDYAFAELCRRYGIRRKTGDDGARYMDRADKAIRKARGGERDDRKCA